MAQKVKDLGHKKHMQEIIAKIGALHIIMGNKYYLRTGQEIGQVYEPDSFPHPTKMKYYPPNGAVLHCYNGKVYYIPWEQLTTESKRFDPISLLEQIGYKPFPHETPPSFR